MTREKAMALAAVITAIVWQRINGQVSRELHEREIAILGETVVLPVLLCTGVARHCQAFGQSASRGGEADRST